MTLDLQKCVLETQMEIYRRQIENVKEMIRECICHPRSLERAFLEKQLELYTRQFEIVNRMLKEVLFPVGLELDEKSEDGFAKLVHQARLNVKKASLVFD